MTNKEIEAVARAILKADKVMPLGDWAYTMARAAIAALDKVRGDTGKTISGKDYLRTLELYGGYCMSEGDNLERDNKTAAQEDRQKAANLYDELAATHKAQTDEIETPRRVNKRLLEALELADAALQGANMNMKVVERKVKQAIAIAKVDYTPK